MITVIVPVYNEETVVSACLSGLLSQTCRSPIQVIVAANGCTDRSVAVCEAMTEAFLAKGYSYRLLNIGRSSKVNALNEADAQSIYGSRLYLDADVVCSEDFLEQVRPLLALSSPVYFSGALALRRNQSFVSNAYGIIWKSMPYIRNSVVGIGCYGVNAAGRLKWNTFPAIHSDDKFVRLLFNSAERRKLAASYLWPVPEGLFTLVKVRARWIKGNREFKKTFRHCLPPMPTACGSI